MTLKEIRQRANIRLSGDDYRKLSISEIAQMRMDVKRLLKEVDTLRAQRERANEPPRANEQIKKQAKLWKEQAKLIDQECGDTTNELSHMALKLSAALSDLNGNCWCCIHGKPFKIGIQTLTTCEYIGKRGSVAGAGNSKCEHWEWRGPISL